MRWLLCNIWNHNSNEPGLDALALRLAEGYQDNQTHRWRYRDGRARANRDWEFFPRQVHGKH
jgi:hypothetical protein